MRQFGRVLLIGALSTPIWAAGTGLPWEGPLQIFKNSMTGPVPWALGAVGIVAAAIGGHYHEQIGEIVHRIGARVFVTAGAVGAVALMATLYGVSGAVV